MPCDFRLLEPVHRTLSCAGEAAGDEGQSAERSVRLLRAAAGEGGADRGAAEGA